jgi:hypothetical protein
MIICKKARVFVLGKLYQPSLMFVGEARSLPKSGAPERTKKFYHIVPWAQFINLFCP